MSIKKLCYIVLLVFSVSIFSGCSTFMSGSPSLTLLTDKIDRNSKGIKLISQEESVCSALFIGPAGLVVSGTSNNNHEQVINKFLDKYRADLIVNANITDTWYGIPGLFIVIKSTVEGYPAIFVKGGETNETKYNQ